ncbi:MAG: hypothetical protein E2O29_02135 [Deltaproteobacteria bacterium]|nr:MAG: hypothetical protein E2O29_02135 [Deltaproteobacteria bacterium]
MADDRYEGRIKHIENEVDGLKYEVTELGKLVTEVNTHVTNHLPHLIEENGNAIKAYGKRLEPLETKSLKVQGASEFLSIVLKVLVIIIGLGWTIIRVISHFTG